MARSASPEVGSREGALELLQGIVTTLAAEADQASDDVVHLRLACLMADVLETIDELGG